MKWLLCLGFFVWQMQLRAQSDLVQMRLLYFKAGEDEGAATDLVKQVEKSSLEASTLDGYRAVAKFLQCKYAYNPYKKFSLFNQARERMERAIAGSPENVELRFLRFSVQCHLPNMLGYHADIEMDKKVLLAYLQSDPPSNDDKHLAECIRKLLLESGLLEQTEINVAQLKDDR